MPRYDLPAYRFWLFLICWQLDLWRSEDAGDLVHALHYRFLEDGGRGDEQDFWRAVQWGHQAGITDLIND